MSADKYPTYIFPRQMEAIVLVILEIFFATRAIWKIGKYLVNKPIQAAGMSAETEKRSFEGKCETEDNLSAKCIVT